MFLGYTSQSVLSYSDYWLMIAAAETQASSVTYLFYVILALHSKQEWKAVKTYSVFSSKYKEVLKPAT